MAVSFPYVSGACNSTDRPINMWPIESLNSYIYTQLVGLLRIAQKSASIRRRTSTFTPQKLYKIPPIFGKIYDIIPLKIPSQRNINSSKLIKIKVIENNLKFFFINPMWVKLEKSLQKLECLLVRNLRWKEKYGSQKF